MQWAEKCPKESIDSDNIYISRMERDNLIILPEQLAISAAQAALLKTEILMKEVEKDVLLTALDKDAPLVKQIEAELKGLKENYSIFYKDSDDGLFVNFNKAPRLTIEFEKIKRKTEYYTEILKFVGAQLEEAKIEEIKDLSSFQILDTPQTPDKKYKPSRSKIVTAAFLLAFSLNLIWIYLRERWILETE